MVNSILIEIEKRLAVIPAFEQRMKKLRDNRVEINEKLVETVTKNDLIMSIEG